MHHLIKLQLIFQVIMSYKLKIMKDELDYYILLLLLMLIYNFVLSLKFLHNFLNNVLINLFLAYLLIEVINSIHLFALINLILLHPLDLLTHLIDLILLNDLYTAFIHMLIAIFFALHSLFALLILLLYPTTLKLNIILWHFQNIQLFNTIILLAHIFEYQSIFALLK